MDTAKIGRKGGKTQVANLTAKELSAVGRKRRAIALGALLQAEKLRAKEAREAARNKKRGNTKKASKKK